MKRRLVAVAMAILALGLGAGCRERPKKKNRYENLDGGRQLLEECNKPAEDCYSRCFKREASDSCMGCCWDERFLCDTHQPFSFQHCDATK